MLYSKKTTNLKLCNQCVTAAVGVQLPGNILVKSFVCNNVSETECYTTSEAKTALVIQICTLSTDLLLHTCTSL